MGIKVYYDNRDFKECIEYAFETIFRCFNLKNYSFEIGKGSGFEKGIFYGESCPNDFKGVFIKSSLLFSDSYLKKDSIPRLPVQYYEDIPVLFSSEHAPSVTSTLDRTTINFDIVQGSFFCVTGYDEIVDDDIETDNHSRVSHTGKLLYKINRFEKPVVNMYARLLEKSMLELGLIDKRFQRKPIAHISHDVDRPFRHQPYYYIKRYLQSKLKVHIPMRLEPGFKIIKRAEEKYSINSSWFFMVGGNNPWYDFCYDIGEQEIQKLIKSLEESGDEVGWHYSYECGTDMYLFRKESQIFKVERSKIFGRNHYLRYRIPYSWRAYQKSNLLYDSSLGFSKAEGFAYGICTPFELFDAVNRVNTNVWEIPLIVMDGTVCDSAEREMDVENAKKVIKNLMDEVKNYSGVFSFLWHNTSIKKKGWKKWRPVYYSTMAVLAKEFECLLGEEIIKRYE
ncbi:hypothetical protein SAMN02910339_00470 [Lachnospiraceae bacterium YSD2013]|nr:hypothetical protein SAMN02910339_00470 [Lachnospiraceae bacterium YSD2013]